MGGKAVSAPYEDLADGFNVQLTQLVNGKIAEVVHLPSISLIYHGQPLVNSGDLAVAQNTVMSRFLLRDWSREVMWVTYGGYKSQRKRVKSVARTPARIIGLSSEQPSVEPGG